LKAYEYYNKVFKLKRNPQILFYKKGRCLRALYKYKEAIDLFNEAIKLNDKYISAYNYKGLCLMSLNKDSMDTFTKAYELNINPTNSNDLFEKAITLYCLENYEESLVYYNKYLQLEPNDSVAYNNKGVLLKRLEKYNESIECYNKSIELNLNYAYSYNNKGFNCMHAMLTLTRTKQIVYSI